MIRRSEYIDKFKKYKDKEFIKVLTGLRRVGKSTILDMFIDELVDSGVSGKNILKLNFELPNTFDILNFRDLTKVVETWKSGKVGKLYIFLDEISRVEDWERAVNAFHAMKEFDIYITGSNADLLSSDLATYLGGRFVEILVYPLSYKEFKKIHLNSTFNDYVVFGGIPSISTFDLNYDLSMNALRDSFNSAIYQDIIKRYNIRNSTVLDRLIKYIFTNTSNTFSALSISNYFKSERISVSVDTIISYLKNMEEAFLIYKVSRNDILGKRVLKTEEKYYIADHGLREAIVGGNMNNIELILENIVYTELIRRGYKVYIGKVGELEIDFIAMKNNVPTYYQVSYIMETEKTRNREFDVYNQVTDNYSKYVLSMDKVNFSRNGIIHKNIIDFLLE